MSVLWSCGGGTQSAAIGALIYRGELPKPDIAVIADTGREASSTWWYYDNVLYPRLREVGVEIHRIPHDWATVDLWSGKKGDTVVMPMFTNRDGGGQLPKYCSNEWKTRPIQRFAKSRGYTSGVQWIGFTTDELRRYRAAHPKNKWNHSYPLIERHMSRADAVKYVLDTGWPLPPRSSCWMCPYRSDQEWQMLSEDDFGRAVELEREIRQRDPHAFFHRSCVPLDRVSFDSTGDMIDMPCDTGNCFT